MMFDESPNNARCAFRPQGQLSAAAVFKYVHLFLDHIGHVAEGSLKKFNRLERRSPNLLVPISLEKRSRDGFHFLELRGIDGKNVLGTTNRLKLRHGQKL